jgi:hypothetical protein
MNLNWKTNLKLLNKKFIRYDKTLIISIWQKATKLDLTWAHTHQLKRLLKTFFNFTINLNKYILNILKNVYKKKHNQNKLL